MDLSVITVNTNDGKLIFDQINSVMQGADDLLFEHIISDNGSTDGSVEEIKKKFSYIQIIENGKNIGFGAANNRALQNATGEFILFLNPDMRVSPGSLRILVNYMKEREDVGILCCKLVDEHGKLNEDAKPRRFPKLSDQLALVLKISKIFPGLLNSYLYKDFDFDKEREVDSVRGSFMLTRRVIIDRLGWAFDPRYFIWFEDVDTCREIRRLGFKVLYTPVVSCVDYVGQTFKKLPSVQKQKWFTRSMVTYFKKWEPWYIWIWIAIARPIGVALVWINSKFVRR